MRKIFLIIISFVMLSLPFSIQGFAQGYDDFDPESYRGMLFGNNGVNEETESSPQTSEAKQPEEDLSKLLEETEEKADIRLEDIYYYDKERNKTYPEISTKKIAVLFDNKIKEEHIKQLLKKDKSLVDAYVLEDPGLLLRTLIIFELKEDAARPETAIYNTIWVLNIFNRLQVTELVSPVFIIDGKEYIFTGVFEMKLKNNLSERMKSALTQAEFTVETVDTKDSKLRKCHIRLEKHKLNSFQIMNQFAEDFEVVYAIPIFKEIGNPVIVKQEVDLDGAKLGGKIPYKLTVIRDEGVTIDPSSLTTLILLPSSELFSQQLNEYDPTDVIKGTRLVVTGHVQFFSPGDYTIPEREIAYITKDGKTRVIRSNELNIRIASIIPEKSKVGIIATTPLEKYQPKVNIKAMYTIQNLKMIGLTILSSLIIALIAVPLFRWWKKSTTPQAVNPVPGALESLKTSLSSDKEGKEYFSDVSQKVRSLLSALTGTKFDSGTVESVKAKLKAKKLDSLAEKSSAILSLCEKALSTEQLISSKNELLKAAEELTSEVNQ